MRNSANTLIRILVSALVSPLVVEAAKPLPMPLTQTQPPASDWRQELPDMPYAPNQLPGLPLETSPPALVQQGPFVSVQVNVDAMGMNILGDAANEPSIAVDPMRPNRMAIGWRQFDTVSSNFRQAGWGHSRDGGRSWLFPGVIEPGIFRSDPVLRSDGEGSFYYNSLTNEVGVGYWCKVFKSIDGGQTWNNGVYAFGGDKGWMAIDRTGGIGNGNIYFAWDYAGCCGNNWFNRSTDGGASFEQPVPIPEQPIWGLTTVGPDGEVYIAGRRNSTNTQFVLAKSTTIRDPGVSLGFDLGVQVDMGGVHQFAIGTGPNPGGLHGNVCVATDHSSSATRGYVYVLASVDPPGIDPMDVHIIRSTDGGQNWSAPVRANDDAVGTNAWQWFAAMDVAPNGRIDVVWNDTRSNPGGVVSQLYYAYSTNAGQTFSTNVAVGPAFDPLIGWPSQNKLGDYYDMTSDLVGAHVAYAATYNGEQDVYYVRIGDYDCNNNGVGDLVDIAGGASDSNANGILDECEVNTPAVAPFPHDRLKNRYLSFTPNNGTESVAFRVSKLTAPSGACWAGVPDAQGNTQCTAVPVFRIWPEPAVHVGDCEVVPVAEYQIAATQDGVGFSSPLSVRTILLPSLNNKLWGDVAGVNNGTEWTPPNQFTNVNDVLAVLAFISGAPVRPQFTVVNLQAISSADSCLNAFVNTSDVLISVRAIAGDSYGPPATGKIIDPVLCPNCP